MCKVHFLFVGEGPTDNGLVPHLEALCVKAGAIEASSVIPDFRRLPANVGHAVCDKVEAALTLEPGANLIFVHRDADSRDAEPRREEITMQLARVANAPTHVPVVPVQEIEAWLLLDEVAIRRVSENPRGTMGLGIPAAHEVENIASPKERLQLVLRTANGTTGRRLHKFTKEFPRHRRRLLENLDIDGRLSEVPAWERLVNDIRRAVQLICGANGADPRN